MMYLFCILSRQRSGSMLLVDLLNSHPEVIALRELFIRERKVNNSVEPGGSVRRYFEYQKISRLPRPFSVIRYMFHVQNVFMELCRPDNSMPGLVGFKLMYGQFKHYPEILFGLMKGRYKIIHLVRENHLDVILSGINKGIHGVGHSKESISQNPVYLDPGSILKLLRRKERCFSFAKCFMSALPLPVYTLSYEKLSSVADDGAEELLRFLGVSNPDITLSSNFKKLAKGSYTDRIANYQEVVNALNGTRYEYLLKT